ncbi:hypothetical protein [Corynebacterium urinipleomorphum]|uniref:hypothetical protein n=1 Tax=Corynebacterium urinipleomorphum TaxID=1852380 RepID=UPI000B35BB38|nr:hypothetical protein [Corynebacterium urinipleomorphum]
MKRFNKTAVALATAGAMTLAIVPNAVAEDGVVTDTNQAPVPGAPSFGPGGFENPGNPSIDEASAGDEADTIVNGTPVADPTLPPRPVKLGDDEPIEESQDAFQPIPVTLNKGDQIVDFAGNVQHTAQADGEYATLEPGDRVIRNGKEVTNEVLGSKDDNAPRPVTLKWGDVIVDRDGRIVWSAKANGENAVLQDGDKVVPAGRIAAGVLGTLAAVTLGGVLYNVVKNSKGEPVLVPAERADQTPTAEDEAKTKELVENNAEELAAQAAAQNGGADARTPDNADRGVGAATGNNSIAKGLVGLLIASIMGAAAFAFGRRRLV